MRQEIYYHTLYEIHETSLILDKTFMEIEQTKALTALALFGNAGGYLGMFLGCALMQLPDFMYTLHEWFRKLYEAWKQL